MERKKVELEIVKRCLHCSGYETECDRYIPMVDRERCVWDSVMEKDVENFMERGEEENLTFDLNLLIGRGYVVE